MALRREKRSQLDRLADFHARHAGQAPAALERLKTVATSNGNVFGELMEAVRCCSLGQISEGRPRCFRRAACTRRQPPTWPFSVSLRRLELVGAIRRHTIRGDQVPLLPLVIRVLLDTACL